MLSQYLTRKKGDSPHLCEAPFGPSRQMGTVPFFPPTHNGVKLTNPSLYPLGAGRQRCPKSSVVGQFDSRIFQAAVDPAESPTIIGVCLSDQASRKTPLR